MRVVDDEDLVDQHLISELRKEYGMTYNDFFMVLTDVDYLYKMWFLKFQPSYNHLSKDPFES